MAQSTNALQIATNRTLSCLSVSIAEDPSCHVHTWKQSSVEGACSNNRSLQKQCLFLPLWLRSQRCILQSQCMKSLTPMYSICNVPSSPETAKMAQSRNSMHKLAGNMPASSSLAQWSKLHPAQPVHEKQSHQPLTFCKYCMNTVLYKSRFKHPHSSFVCNVPSSPWGSKDGTIQKINGDVGMKHAFFFISGSEAKAPSCRASASKTNRTGSRHLYNSPNTHAPLLFATFQHPPEQQRWHNAEHCFFPSFLMGKMKLHPAKTMVYQIYSRF